MIKNNDTLIQTREQLNKKIKDFMGPERWDKVAEKNPTKKSDDLEKENQELRQHKKSAEKRRKQIDDFFGGTHRPAWRIHHHITKVTNMSDIIQLTVRVQCPSCSKEHIIVAKDAEETWAKVCSSCCEAIIGCDKAESDFHKNILNVMAGSVTLHQR